MPRKIALFSIGWAHDLLFDYASGVVKRMQGMDVDLYMFICYPTLVSENALIKGELNIFNLPVMEDFDGAIVLGNSIDHPSVFEAIVQKCKDAGIPLVSTGRKDDYAYFVGSDNREGARGLYEHLIEKHGVKTILYVAGVESNEDSRTRYEVLCEVMKENGLDPESVEIFHSQWEPKLAVEFIHSRYEDRKNPLPDAFVCANDNLATSVCIALEEIGYEVPKDTKITGFDNDYTSEIYSPSITSVNQRFDDIGAYALKILLDVIDGNKRNHEVLVGCELFESESCGCTCVRDLDNLRRLQAKSVFLERMKATLFERSSGTIERRALAALTFEEFETNIRESLKLDSTFTGNTFHLVLEPAFCKALSNIDTKFRKDGYSKTMNVVFSKENGKVSNFPEFDSKKLIPQKDPDKKNRVFIFVPLHEYEDNFGYMVFGDNVDVVASGEHLFEFMSRMDVIMSKVKQNISLRFLNAKLVELTETDALTRVKNRAAYSSREEELNSLIRSGVPVNFAIGVFDVNDLKKINDNLGHESGDAYIVNSCQLLCKTFKNSPVYRIGGDEFAVVLQDEDYDRSDELIASMRDKMLNVLSLRHQPEEKVSIAGGIGRYEPGKDKDVSDVFARADSAMYEDKLILKEKMKEKKL